MKRDSQASSLANWIQAYLKSGRNEQRSIWQYLRVKDPYLFAHHPGQACFRSHVWKLGGFYWCKGCLMSTVGGLLGLLLQLVFAWQQHIPDWQMGIALLLLLLPTLAAVLLRLPGWLKHGSRLLLGLATAAALLQLFITDSWHVRGIIVLSFIAIRQPLARYRKQRNRKLAESN